MRPARRAYGPEILESSASVDGTFLEMRAAGTGGCVTHRRDRAIPQDRTNAAISIKRCAAYGPLSSRSSGDLSLEAERTSQCAS
jgi:hypothetical protein